MCTHHMFVSLTLMRRSMSASTLEMVILCMTMSMIRRSRVCHFWRADLEKLGLLAAAVLPSPAGLSCSFFLLLRGENAFEPCARVRWKAVGRKSFLPVDSCPVHAAFTLSQISVGVVLVVPLPHQTADGPPALGLRAAGCGAGWQVGSGVCDWGTWVPAGHAARHAVRHGFGQAAQGGHLLSFPPQHQLLLPLLGLQRSDLVLKRKTIRFYILIHTKKSI